MITRRASVTALAAVAVAGLASGCLSSNSGGGSSGGGTASGPGKGDRRSHVRLRRRAGRPPSRRTSTSSRRRTGSRSSSPRPDRGTPRSARGSPVATRRTSASSRSPASCATSPSRRRSWPGTTPTSRRRAADMVNGLRGRRHVRRRQGLRPAGRRQRQEPPLVRPAELAERPVTSSRRRSTDAHAERPAQGAGQDAVVHRGGVRQRHRLADHRLDRGPRPSSGRPGELRQVGHRVR